MIFTLTTDAKVMRRRCRMLVYRIPEPIRHNHSHFRSSYDPNDCECVVKAKGLARVGTACRSVELSREADTESDHKRRLCTIMSIHAFNDGFADDETGDTTGALVSPCMRLGVGRNSPKERRMKVRRLLREAESWRALKALGCIHNRFNTPVAFQSNSCFGRV